MKPKNKCQHSWTITVMEAHDTHGLYQVRTCKKCGEERKRHPHVLNHLFR
jgi:hypothetical protein